MRWCLERLLLLVCLKGAWSLPECGAILLRCGSGLPLSVRLGFIVASPLLPLCL